MADKYINTAYVLARVGTAFAEAAFRNTAGAYVAASLGSTIEDATALTKVSLRRMSYTVPTTGTAYPDLQVFCFSIFYELTCGRPENMMGLPDDWANNPSKAYHTDVINGDAHMSLPKSVQGAVGGVKFSETTAGTAGAVFTRDEMEGL